jgi:phosphoribosylaminoimidazole-succinocarboxamide synthase
METIFKTDFPELKLKASGKVRDIYDLGEYFLFVATDRISAFDVIMDQPIPNKGSILSNISVFWFNETKHIIKNHFVTNDPDEYPDECKPYKEQLQGRSMLVKKCKPLPIECIVRGYIAGSGWKDYLKNRSICGINLPDGLVEYSRLPEPIFTPSTKAVKGHDENIPFNVSIEIVGKNLAEQLRQKSLDLFDFASDHLYQRGIILADTKFEFGLDDDDNLILIDEAITPDSSRFWLKEFYEPGKAQMNFDKQVLRDYLESTNWNKQPPAPELPNEIIIKTTEKYQEAYNRIIKQ